MPNPLTKEELGRWSQRNKDAFNGITGGLLAVNNFVPITGDIQSGILTANDIKNGDYGSAALNGIGLLPWVPSLAGAIKLTKYEKAHEVARKNAVEMLGLPENNTAMDRAKALGFDTNLYHGRYRDYNTIKGSFYATPDPEYASVYTNPSASSMGGKSIEDFVDPEPNVMPVMVRSSDVLNTNTQKGKNIFNKDFYMQYGNGTPLSDKGYPDWVDAEDFGQMFSDKNMKWKGVLADEGGYPLPDGTVKSRGISTIMFNPSAVRSRFAAFDPARINEPDLLGSINPTMLPYLLGAGLLGAYGVNQYGN